MKGAYGVSLRFIESRLLVVLRLSSESGLWGLESGIEVLLLPLTTVFGPADGAVDWVLRLAAGCVGVQLKLWSGWLTIGRVPPVTPLKLGDVDPEFIWLMPFVERFAHDCCEPESV